MTSPSRDLQNLNRRKASLFVLSVNFSNVKYLLEDRHVSFPIRRAALGATRAALLRAAGSARIRRFESKAYIRKLAPEFGLEEKDISEHLGYFSCRVPEYWSATKGSYTDIGMAIVSGIS